jgi:hypothetical protein
MDTSLRKNVTARDESPAKSRVTAGTPRPGHGSGPSQVTSGGS